MIRDTFVQQKLVAALSGGFAALAAVLTMVGLYGLVAYTVSRRTPEIGLRMALGATAANVVSLLLRETGVLLLIGIACGIALSLAGGPTAGALLFWHRTVRSWDSRRSFRTARRNRRGGELRSGASGYAHRANGRTADRVIPKRRLALSGESASLLFQATRRTTRASAVS